MNASRTLEDLVAAVQANPKYRTIHPELVRRVAAIEQAKGRNWKETIKATRNKLHQVGGAYQENEIEYDLWTDRLDALPSGLSSEDVQLFCKHLMAHHASTKERLPILETFYAEALAPLGPVRSVIDLACGLNPLCLPWIPLAEGAPYYACDIYAESIAFINRFFAHFRQPGEAFLCDLIGAVPDVPAHLALLLKTIPCLEQVDKSIGSRLLEQIPAENLLVSFPAQSLGGRSKGMVDNYEAHFHELVAGKDWSVTRFEFQTELAFLIRRP
ncbi:MAG TPA: hypothetical protein VFF68_04645 [Anaerolineaceae bacterium]|nr:hypothetical protein [Anaerolineaceae bacterium]